MVENIVGKKRKCWLPAFSPYSTMFSKGFFIKVVKSRGGKEVISPIINRCLSQRLAQVLLTALSLSVLSTVVRIKHSTLGLAGTDTNIAETWLLSLLPAAITIYHNTYIFMVAYFCHEIRDSYHDDFREVSQTFLEIVSR